MANNFKFGAFGSGSFGSGTFGGQKKEPENKSTGTGASRSPSVVFDDLSQEEQDVYKPLYQQKMRENPDDPNGAMLFAEDGLFTWQNNQRYFDPKGNLVSGSLNQQAAGRTPSIIYDNIQDKNDKQAYYLGYRDFLRKNPGDLLGAQIAGEDEIRRNHLTEDQQLAESMLGDLSMGSNAPLYLKDQNVIGDLLTMNGAGKDQISKALPQYDFGIFKPKNQGPTDAAYAAAMLDRQEREQRDRDDAATGAGSRVQQIVAEKELERSLADGSIQNEQLRQQAESDLARVRNSNQTGDVFDQNGLAGLWSTIDAIRNEGKAQALPEAQPAETENQYTFGAVDTNLYRSNMEAAQKKIRDEIAGGAMQPEELESAEADLAALTAYMDGTDTSAEAKENASAITEAWNKEAVDKRNPVESFLADIPQLIRESTLNNMYSIINALAGNTDAEKLNTPTLDKYTQAGRDAYNTVNDAMWGGVDAVTNAAYNFIKGVGEGLQSAVVGANALAKLFGFDAVNNALLGENAVDTTKSREFLTGQIQKGIVEPADKEAVRFKENLQPKITTVLSAFGMDKETAQSAADIAMTYMGQSSEMVGRMVPSLVASWAAGGSGAGEAANIIGRLMNSWKTPGFLSLWLTSTGEAYQGAIDRNGENVTYGDALASLIGGFFDATIENYETKWGFSNGVQAIAGGRRFPRFSEMVGGVASETSEELKQLFSGDVWENFGDILSGRQLTHALNGDTEESLFYVAKYLDTAKDTVFTTLGMNTIIGAGNVAANMYQNAVQAVVDGNATPEQMEQAQQVAMMAAMAQEDQVKDTTVTTPSTEEQHDMFEAGLAGGDQGAHSVVDGRAQAEVEIRNQQGTDYNRVDTDADGRATQDQTNGIAGWYPSDYQTFDEYRKADQDQNVRLTPEEVQEIFLGRKVEPERPAEQRPEDRRMPGTQEEPERPGEQRPDNRRMPGAQEEPERPAEQRPSDRRMPGTQEETVQEQAATETSREEQEKKSKDLLLRANDYEVQLGKQNDKVKELQSLVDELKKKNGKKKALNQALKDLEKAKEVRDELYKSWWAAESELDTYVDENHLYYDIKDITEENTPEQMEVRADALEQSGAPQETVDAIRQQAADLRAQQAPERPAEQRPGDRRMPGVQEEPERLGEQRPSDRRMPGTQEEPERPGEQRPEDRRMPGAQEEPERPSEQRPEDRRMPGAQEEPERPGEQRPEDRRMPGAQEEPERPGEQRPSDRRMPGAQEEPERPGEQRPEDRRMPGAQEEPERPGEQRPEDRRMPGAQVEPERPGEKRPEDRRMPGAQEEPERPQEQRPEDRRMPGVQEEAEETAGSEGVQTIADEETQQAGEGAAQGRQEAAGETSAEQAVQQQEESEETAGNEGQNTADNNENTAGIGEAAGNNTKNTNGETNEEQRKADEINRTFGFNQRNTDGSTSYKPGLTVSSWKGELSDQTRTELQVIHEYAKEHGFSVVMDSTLRTSKVKGVVNGFYARDEGGGRVIHLAQDGRAPLRTTLGHELYHMISNLNKNGAQQMERLYRDYASRMGIDVEKLIDDKLVSYKDLLDKDAQKARAQALEEVIADAMYDVIGDERTMRVLAMEDRGMAERIRDWADRVLRDIRRLIDRYGSNKAEARVLHEQADAMENMRAAIERVLAETKELQDAKKAARSLGSNSQMLNDYHQMMDTATTREEMNAATLALAGQVLEKGGIEANWDNMRTLMTAALDYASGGGVISQVLNAYDMNTWIPSDEANRAFVSMGRYIKQMLESQDEAGYMQLMGMDQETASEINTETNDSRYMRAMNSGDTQEQQKMVQQAAEQSMANSKMRNKNGSLKKYYHGTKVDNVTVFRKEKIGTRDPSDQGWFGRGFYFAFNKNETDYEGKKKNGWQKWGASHYGDNIIEAYLDVENPFDFEKEIDTIDGINTRFIQGENPNESFNKAVALTNLTRRFPEALGGRKLEVYDGKAQKWYEMTYKEFADKFYQQVMENHDLRKAKFYQTANFPLVTELIQSFDFSGEVRKLGYDGIIESATGDEAVVFESSQIKSAEPVTYDDDGNVIPLSERFNKKEQDIRYSYNDDIDHEYQQIDNVRFSVDSPVEETRELVAVHNLDEDKLKGNLDLGGMPMPSIAITKSEKGHTSYGNISLVFKKDTIDPQANRNNEVFSRDAWTTTFPNIEREVLEDKAVNVINKLNSAKEKLPEYLGRDMQYIMSYMYEQQVSDYTADTILDKAKDNIGMMAAYLADKGETIEEEYKIIPEKKQWVALPEREKLYAKMYDAVRDMVNSPIDLMNIPVSEMRSKISEAVPEFTKYVEKRQDTLIAQMVAYANQWKTEEQKVLDAEAINKKIQDKVNKNDYEKWLKDLFAGVFGDKAIALDVDRYTKSGNRKSYKQTHAAFTLENVVREMSKKKGRNQTGGLFSGYSELAAGASKRFKSVKDIRANRDMIKNWEDVEGTVKSAEKKMVDLINDIRKTRKTSSWENEFIIRDQIASNLIEAAQGKHTDAAIGTVLKKYYPNISEDLIRRAGDLIREAENMPTSYFEAKPARAVTFDEVALAVVPDSTTLETIDRLKAAGVKDVQTYPDGDNEKRKDIINNAAELKFSVSNEPDADAVRDQMDLGSDIARTSDAGWQVIDTMRQMKLRQTQNEDGAVQQTPGYWKKQVPEIAKSLKEYTYGKDQKAIEKAVKELYADLDSYQGDARGFVDYALREAQGTMRDLYTDERENPTRDNLKAFFDKYGPLYVTEEQKKELRYYAVGMTEFRRQAAGLVPITNKKSGIGLEEVWEELAPLIGKDPSIVSVGTMIMEFNDAIEKARSVNGEERTLTDEEMAMLDRRALDLVAEYMEAGATVVPTRTVEKIDADKHQQALKEVSRLQDETEKQNVEIERLNKKLEDADNVNQSLNRQLFDQAKVVDQLKKSNATRAEVEEARAAYREIAAQSAEAVKAMKDLQKKLETVRQRRDEYRRQLAQAHKAEQQYEKAQHQIERLQAGRDSLKKQIEQMKLKAMDTRLIARQTRERNKALTNIRKKGGELRAMFASPSEKKGYIPMDQVRAAADLVESLVDAEKGGSAAKMSKRLENALRDARESNDYQTSVMYDEGLYHDMQDVTRLLEDKGSLRNLSNSELNFVEGTLTSIVHQIKTSNETVGRQKNQALQDEAEDAIRVMKENPRELNGIGRLIRKFGLTQLNAQRYFSIMGHHGNNAWTRMRDELSEGQRKKNMLTMNMTKTFENLTRGENEKKFDKFTGKNAVWYDTGLEILKDTGEGSGRNWKMNGAMRSFFGLSWMSEENREAMRAVGEKSENGGDLYQLTIPDEELMKKGKEKEAYARGERVYFTAQDAERIIGEMTDYEKAWMNAWWDMEKLSKAAINETSQLLNGYRKANVNRYVPIFRDPRYIGKEFESVVTDARLTSMGFLKERVNAHNPMMLMDLTNVINRQVRDVSAYYGFAIPVRNATRIYNGKMPGNTTSVKEVINKTQGMEYAQYFEKLMSDLQGGIRTESSIMDKMRGTMAAATLGVNPTVRIKQAASYPTAAAVIGWKPLAKALKYANPVFLKNFNPETEIDPYTSAHWERRSQNLSDLEANAHRNTKAGKFYHYLTNGIQRTDISTTAVIWMACGEYVAENQPELKKGSLEFKQAQARVYEQTLESTQPEYGELQKAGVLRSNNQLVKQFTMYKTQSLQNLGILVDAVTNLSDKAKADKANSTPETQAALREAKIGLARSTSALITGAVVLGVMQALGQALKHKLGGYRDDKGDLTAESVSNQIFKDSISSLAGMAVGGSEAFDFFNGLIEGKSPFDIEAASASMINDMYQNLWALGNSVSVIADSDKTPEQKLQALLPKFRKLGLSAAQLYGVPAGNILGLIDGIAANAADFATGKAGTFASQSPLQIAGTALIGSAQGRETSNKAVAGYIAQAMMNGNQAEAVRLYNEQLRQGKTEDALNTAIATWQKQNIPQIREAAEAIDSGDLVGYNSKINQLVDMGLSMTNAVKYVEAVRKKNEKSGELRVESGAKSPMSYQDIVSGMTKATATSEDMSYTNGMMNSLLEDGNIDAAKAIRDDMLKNGKKSSAINSSLTSFWKPRLQEAYAAGDMAEVRRITNMLVSMGMKRTTVTGWATSGSSTSSSSSSKKSGFGSGSFGSGSFGSSKKSSSKYSSKKSTKKSGFGSGSFGSGTFGK